MIKINKMKQLIALLFLMLPAVLSAQQIDYNTNKGYVAEGYDVVSYFKEKKPVVVLIGEVGASAAYIAALAGDIIFARGNSLVGSIGVIVQYPDLSKLAENLGISLQVIKSSEAKGGPNFFKPMDKKSMKNQEALVNDSFICRNPHRRDNFILPPTRNIQEGIWKWLENLRDHGLWMDS